MNDSKDMKTLIAWVGVAVLAAIPVFLLVRKLAQESEKLFNDTDIFAEELRG